MTTERLAPVGQGLSRGARCSIGRYRYDVAADRWWWSDEAFRIHGFEPGDVVPTTALLLAHEHPEDRDHVRRVLEQARISGEPFASVHRIMDASGTERTLAIVGEGRHDGGAGDVTELTGFFVDMTAPVALRADARASASIRASAANRAAIEQAKGILAHVLGVGIDEAFDVLRRASNLANVPLRALAHDIVDHLTDGDGDGDAPVVAELLRQVAGAPSDDEEAR
ncbi:PAS and ANTAR domain-containing protein [Isoptericola sp. NPDC055881]